MGAPYAPVFASPSSPGALSNTRGANTGADALPLTVTYRNPAGSSDQADTFRVTATRIATGGVNEAPELAWDSGWVGSPTVSSLPGIDAGATHGTVFVYNGRVYCSSRGNTGQVMSAPISGGSVGTWRNETSPPLSYPAGTNHTYTTTYVLSMTQIAGYVYANVASAYSGTNRVDLFSARINSDGTIGPWTRANPGTGAVGATPASQLAAFTDGVANYLLACGGDELTGVSNTVAVVLLNSDGSLDSGSWVVQTATLPANRRRHAVGVFQGTNGPQVVVAGGDDAAAAASTVWVISKATTYGVSMMNVAAIASLPAARTGGAFVVDADGGVTAADRAMYFIGGSSTLLASGATTTIYSSPCLGGTIAWVAETNGLLVATWLHGAVLSDSASFSAGTSVANPLVIVGGQNTTGTNLTTVQATGITASTRATLAGSAGVGSVLGTGSMGTGGSVVANADGSQTITFNFLGPGGPAQTRFSGGFLDGDIVQFSIQFTDVNSGLPSPVAYTTVKIGQPPTIGAVLPANASAPAALPPSASFNYIAGAGGGAEATYRIQIKDAGANVVFDTGIMRDGANAAVLDPARGQRFTNQAYTMIITVASQDTPMSGSSASATSTTTFTPALAAQTPPQTPSATTTPANGSATVSWTAPSGGNPSGGYRVYFRLAGGSAWTLLRTGLAGTATSATFFDELKLRTAYDFAISAIGAAGQESTLATAGGSQNITINPPGTVSQGGFTAMLHQVGNGANLRLGINLFAQGAHGRAETLTRKVDAVESQGFGNLAPSVRLGVFNYRELELKPILQGLATRDTLDALLNAAVTGAILCYRDTVANLVYCSLKPEQKREEGRFHLDDIKLVEVPFTYVP